MITVFLDGHFVDASAATVSAFDAGFQHAVGLFETMLARASPDGPHVLFLDDHIDRLVTSAQQLGLSNDLRAPALADVVVATVRRSGFAQRDAAQARIRLTITGGDLNLLTRNPGLRPESKREAHEPTVLCVAQPATEYPHEMFERGVATTIADLRVNPLDAMSSHKTLHYWPRLRELQAAALKRAAEAIVLTVTNHLAGGCVSSILLVKAGKVLAPIVRGEEEDVARAAGLRTGDSRGTILPSPILPGVTRAWALERARDSGLAVERRMLSIDDLLGADEVLLTNSSWGVLPVVKVEREAIGDGVVGPVARSFVEMWRAGPDAAPDAIPDTIADR